MGRLQSRIGAVAAEYWAIELCPSCLLRRRLRLLLVMMSRIRVRFDHQDITPGSKLDRRLH